ncbi:hypothetical protein [Aureimonas sp. Leaf324]|jgi:hypothetical protein|uniref:hypothetical protein n=1 Tax=Aureimonas sp. Leaf324 TaxID=1736336 RepID=UPI0006FC0A53|nr:hypothetical protein [Aureimonas sp. Leaf324]KQQ81925.1 hypothetical protein ASF65_07675 [Aureimonas sp. Leaf324]
MDDLVRRLAFEIQDDRMSRLQAQRIVSAVLAGLGDGDQIGNALVVRSLAPQPVASGTGGSEVDATHAII